MKKYRDSPEERLIMDSDKAEEVKALIYGIREVPAKRIDTIIEIIQEIKQLKEPEFSDRMEIFRLAINQGFLQAELNEAFSFMRQKKRK